MESRYKRDHGYSYGEILDLDRDAELLNEKEAD